VKERRWVNIVYRKLSGQAEGCHEISIRRTVALIEVSSTVLIRQWISDDILFRKGVTVEGSLTLLTPRTFLQSPTNALNEVQFVTNIKTPTRFGTGMPF